MMVARCSLLKLLVLVFFGGLTTVAEGVTFAPRSATTAVTKKRLLSVRGGAGPLDVDTVAKVGTAVTGIYSSIMVLSPSKACDLFGATPNPKLFALVERMGGAFLGSVVQAFCLVVQGTSLNTAVGASIIPLLVVLIKSILNDEPKKLGFHLEGQILVVVFGLLVTYACFTNAAYANTAIKLHTLWCLVNAVPLVLAPAPVGKMWGWEGDPIITFTVRYLGYALLVAGVYTAALLQDVEGLKALGYAFIPALAGRAIGLFVTKDFEKCGMEMGPNYALLLQEAVMVGTLAI